MFKRIFNLIFANLVIVVFYAIIYQQLKSGHFNGLDKNSSFMDCLYFSCTTYSSVGYGDISPTSNIAKLIVMSQQLLLLVGFASFFYSGDKKSPKKTYSPELLDSYNLPRSDMVYQRPPMSLPQTQFPPPPPPPVTPERFQMPPPEMMERLPRQNLAQPLQFNENYMMR